MKYFYFNIDVELKHFLRAEITQINGEAVEKGLI
jgi:hypothetical protein